MVVLSQGWSIGKITETLMDGTWEMEEAWEADDR